MTRRLQDQAYYITSKLLWYQSGKSLKASQLQLLLRNAMDDQDYQPDTFKSEKDVVLFVDKAFTKNNIVYNASTIRNKYNELKTEYDKYADVGIDHIMASDPRKEVSNMMFNELKKASVTYDRESFDLNQKEIKASDIALVDDVNKLYRERNNSKALRISPFATNLKHQAEIEGVSVEQVEADRKKEMDAMPVSQHQKGNQAGKTHENPLVNNDSETKDGFEQLSDAMGAYLSSKDLRTLRSVVKDEDYHYNDARLEQTVNLLKHMMDNGIEMEVSTKTIGESKSIFGKILNAPVGMGNPTITLVDEYSPEKTSRVGQVNVRDGAYYYRQSSKDAYVPDHPEYIIDTVMGIRTGKTVYTSKAMESTLINTGVQNQAIIYKSYASANKAVLPTYNESTADQKLDQMIGHARKNYYEVFTGPELKELDPTLSAEQETLKAYMKENEYEDDALIDAMRVLNHEELDDDYAVGAYAIADKIREMADAYVGVPANSEEFNPLGKDRCIHFKHTIDLCSRDAERSYDDKMVNAFKQSSWSVNELLDEGPTRSIMIERLISFDEDSAHGIDDAKSDFEQNILKHIEDKLSDTYSIYGEHGRNSLPEVKIDDNGIVKWSGRRVVGRNHEEREVHGEIGQIFLPDEKGVLHTKFLDDEQNFDLVPGINGHFQHEGLEEGKKRMDRFYGEGYEQALYKMVDSSIQRQVIRQGVDGNLAAPTDATMLNKLYHGGIYGKRLDKNWYEESKLEPRVKDAIIETLKGRVRLPNSIGHSANSFLEVGGHGREAGEGDGISALVDNKNIRKLDDDYLGYFDMTMTGTNKSQGLVLYLADGAKLNHDGSITPVTDEHGVPKEARAKVRELDEFKYSKHNPWDRNQMAANQIMTANEIASGTHLMLATAGGWTFEDSCLVSKKWAHEHQVKGADGQMRDLQIGDKISDFSGNKSTIGMIIDPDMDADQAFAENLTNEVDMFKQNPDLDVVMSPYSVISRQNAGIVKELVHSEDKKPVTLVDSNGKTHEVGMMGTANMIVTDMLVDQKTHVYGPEAIKEGHGRKASSQLVWSMNELGLDETMKDLFKGNESAWSATREKLLATGLDLDKDGKLQVGYHPHEGEERTVFSVDEEEVKEAENLAPATESTDKFINELGTRGGLLELPCEIKTGIDDNKTNMIPVMSAGLRRNLELVGVGDNIKISDYTLNYGTMYKNAWKYTYEQQHENRQEYLDKYQKGMQSAYNNIRNNVIMSDLGGYNGETAKHSYVKDHLMSRRQSESATAVQTADPRLSLDTIKISPEIRDTLHLRKDDVIMIERDPALRGSALLAMKWQVDDKLNGIAVNPVIAGMYDGDFDGDTLGCLIAHGKDAQAELKTKATLENRLNDPGNGGSVLNLSMDLISGGLKSGVLSDVNHDQNDRDPETQLSDLVKDIQASSKDNHEAINKLSDLVVNKTMHNVGNFGGASIDITSEESAKQSVREIVATGAKGSPGKADEFDDYMDGKKTLHDAQQVQLAAGAKSDGTGLAGANSQRLMSSFRDIDPKTALEVTYPNTQSVLQVKHESEKGKIILGALTHQLPNLFNGIDKDTPSNAPKRDRRQLSNKEWVGQMKDVYNNTLGIHGVDEHIEKLGQLMSDSNHMIQPLKDCAAKRANVLDQWAYGGGYAVLEQAAKVGRSLTEGKNIQALLPESLRDKNNDKDIMLKQDVRKEVTKEDVKEAEVDDKEVDQKATEASTTSIESEPQSKDEGKDVPTETKVEVSAPKKVKKKAKKKSKDADLEF